MLKKLGFMKLDECIKKITAIRNKYEEKLANLREYIDEVENENRDLKERNKNLSNQNKDLQIEFISKVKEIKYLKQSIQKMTGERFDMALSMRGMFELNLKGEKNENRNI